MYKIIQDTREKKPLDFSFHNIDVVVSRLIAGDYSAEGLEDKLFIERKATTGELCNNFGQKRERFFNELNRTVDMPYKHIICEFSYERILEFPKNSGIPPKIFRYVRVNAGFMKSTIEQIENEYGVIFHFCGNREKAANKIVEIINECKTKEKQ